MTMSPTAPSALRNLGEAWPSCSLVHVATGKVLVEADTVNVFTDKNGKITRIGEPWFSRIQALYEQDRDADRV